MGEHEHTDDQPVLTSPGRMMKGLIIVGVTLIIGAVVAVTQFDNFFSQPPPVARLQVGPPVTPPPTEVGVTTIIMLAGSSVQGNPDYDPDPATVPLGNRVVWVNADNVPHTSTSGTGPTDPNSGVRFDTGIVDGGESSDELVIEGEVGETIPYYCLVHPYMVSEITFTEPEEGAGGSELMLTMLPGSSVQGNPAYDPDPMTVTAGDVITVFNADNVPHTVTSGTGPTDPTSGTLFESGILNGGDTGPIDTSGLEPGTYDYYCLVHPYMVGKLQVT